MMRKLLRALCPLCFTRDIQWHEVGLGPRYYDPGFELFAARCVCTSIYEHPMQSGLVEPMPPEDCAFHSEPDFKYGEEWTRNG